MLVLALMMLAGLGCGSAICFGSAAIARRDRAGMCFAAIALWLMAYAALQAVIFSALDLDDVRLPLRLQGVAAAGIMAVLPWFGAAFVRRRTGWFERSISLGYAVLGLWSLASRNGYWFLDVTHLDRLTLPWGEVISQPRGPFSPAYAASAIMQYPLYGWLFLGVRRLRADGRRGDAWLWGLTTGLMILSVIHDHGVDLGVWAPPYLTEWVFLVLVLVMGVRMGQQAGSSHRELVRLHHDVAERETLYRGVFAAAGDAILVIDRDRIVDHNARAEEIFGAASCGLRGRSVIDLSPPWQDSGPSDQEAHRRIDEAMSGGHRLFEWRHLRADGRPFEAEVTLVAVDLPAGRRLVAVVRDVSEHKRLRAQLEQAQKMESLGRLAGGLSHDFNNMLQGISGNIEMIASRVVAEDDHVHVRAALRQCDQASDLVHRLLAFARREPVEHAPTDLGAVLDDALKLARPSLKAVTVESNLPDAPLWVRGHAGLLQNVFLNLFLNARDAMASGGRLTVAASVQLLEQPLMAFGLPQPLQPGSYAVVSVRDDGAGMDPEVLARCFEPFFSTKGERGTGLGLATAFGTVMAHDGGITVASDPGRGTEFRVYLPLQGDPAPTKRGVMNH